MNERIKQKAHKSGSLVFIGQDGCEWSILPGGSAAGVGNDAKYRRRPPKT
jgi:hypothetical protein